MSPMNFKRYFFVLFNLVFAIFLSSCGVAVDPKGTYDPVFRQDGSKLYVSTQDVPTITGSSQCFLKVVYSPAAGYCTNESYENDDIFCGYSGNYFYYLTKSFTEEITQASKGTFENKEIGTIDLQEIASSYGSFTGYRGNESFTAILYCTGYKPPACLTCATQGTILYDKRTTFAPDTSYVVPLGSSVQLVEKTSTSIKLKANVSSQIGTGVKYQVSLNGTSGWTDIANVTPILVTKYYDSRYSEYTHTGLSPNTTYYYRTQVYITNATSSYSNVLSVTTSAGGGGGAVPTAPSGLSVGSPTSSTLDLTWTDNSSDETGFEIDRSPNGTSGWTTITTTSSNATSYANTGLTASTTYYYRIRAINGSGNSSYTSVANATTSAGGGGGIPTAPSSLVGFPDVMSPPEITLTWADNSSDETGFEVERSPDGSTSWTNLTTTGAGVTSYNDNTALASTTYYYRVRAINGSGPSAYTSVTSVVNP